MRPAGIGIIEHHPDIAPVGITALAPHPAAQRVGQLAARLARELGLPDRDVTLIGHAAPLHDIGKIAIPDSILLKPGRLTEEEFEVVKTHAALGARVLAGGGSDLFMAAEAIARPIARAWNGVSDYDRLERENQALRDQLDAQKGAEVTARAAVLQYQAIVDLYELSKDYSHVMARVTGEAPSNFQNTAQITVGADRGVKVGMPVLSSAGLVGSVVTFEPTNSR